MPDSVEILRNAFSWSFFLRWTYSMGGQAALLFRANTA